MKKLRKFWIKKRYNPQLEVYYVACGQLSQTDARRKERSLYGSNEMLAYDTEEAYLKALRELNIAGHRV